MNYDPNASRATLGELKKFADTMAFKLMVRWLDEVVWDLRVAQDKLDIPELYRSQGKIQEVKKLIGDLLAKRANLEDHRQGEVPWGLE